MSSHLCKVCHAALIGRDYRKYERKDTEAFFMTFALLEKSAADGCLVCSQLLNRFSPQCREHLREAARKCNADQERESCVKFNFRCVTSRVEMLVKFNFPNAKDIRWHDLYLVPAGDVESSTDSRKISPSTGSAESLATAARWFDDCIRRHSSCTAGSTTFNPTRLIDLGLGQIPQPRLYEVPEGCSKLAYMALSHCWGGKVPYKLMKGSLKSMKKMIPVSELSRTLRDAMTVVRKLGMRYLWADTLCIVQDSMTDWQVESTRMGSVYKNSACTIAASAASSGDVGCFFERDTHLIEPRKFQNPSFKDLIEFYCIDRDIWEKEVMEGPLNQRGWVLQELLLSPRTLHFGRNQIFYTCRKLEACETFPKYLPTTILTSVIKRISNEIVAPKHNYEESMFAWNVIVDYYSQRQLTNGKDKLVAVSGLAKEMRLILNDEYLAGIWRKTLPWGLLWYIFSTDVDDTVRYPEYRAPSWSWASIDGKICTRLEIPKSSDYIDWAEVQEARVTSTVGDAITHVTDGFIRLKGRLTTCWFDRKDMPLAGELWGLTSTGNQRVASSVNPDTGGPKDEVVGDLYCFPIMVEKETDSTEGLLLQRAEKKGTFRRFGTFSTRSDYNEGAVLLSDVCNIFDKSTNSEDWEYQETEKGKKYVITII